MGTRCLTHFYSEAGDVLATLYRQFDGYPSGHGDELAAFIASRRIVNGMCQSDDRREIANGAGCLAALAIAHFKGNEPGGFYLQKPGASDVGEEYIYHVRPRGPGATTLIEIYTDDGKRLYSGTAAGLNGQTVEAEGGES